MSIEQSGILVVYDDEVFSANEFLPLTGTWLGRGGVSSSIGRSIGWERWGKKEAEYEENEIHDRGTFCV